VGISLLALYPLFSFANPFEERFREHIETSLIRDSPCLPEHLWIEGAAGRRYKQRSLRGALTAAVLLRQHVVHAVEAELKPKGKDLTATAA
jgi:hypothetical protein